MDGLVLSLTLKMVDEDGFPVPDVRFVFAIMPISKFTLLKDSEPATHEARLDAHGSWQTEADRGELLFVRVTDPGWSCGRPDGSAWQQKLSRRLSASAAVFCLTNGPYQTLTLTLLRDRECRLSVEYADGQPYEGEISIGCFNDAQRSKQVRRFQVIRYQPLMAITSSKGTWLRVTLRAPRPGYLEHFVADPDPETVMLGDFKLVIPEDPGRAPPGGFILDHWSFQPGQIMNVRLSGAGGGSYGQMLTLSGPGETRTTDFPTPQRMGCVGAGANCVWASGLILIEEGQWRRVVVEPQQPCRLALIVENEAGERLPGAVVSDVSASHANWMSLRQSFRLPTDPEPLPKAEMTSQEFGLLQSAMLRAKADQSGEVVFSATVPGRRSFYVEAVGYECRTIAIDLKPSERMDYGVVTLQKATSSVVVRVICEQGVDPAGFQVYLYIPFGGSGHEKPVRFNEDGEAGLESIPASRYQVFVSSYPTGGEGWSKVIDLAVGQRQDVVIDLRQPPGLQVD
ncbi:MAG: hypothetical protein IT464_10005 [Planctomycetes bacterium]|nr:hypothetical protein [Planctomycetota bacterium]